VTRSVGLSRRHVALLFLLVAGLLTSGIATTPARAGTGLRGEMLQLINDARERNDRKALELDVELSKYARRHSQDMADAGGLFHTANLAAKLKDVHWSSAGENIGTGGSLANIKDAFMASKPHRQNVLNRDFDHVAIGVVESGRTFWVTVIFYG
jgi:uncharacterized protein YkwD